MILKIRKKIYNKISTKYRINQQKIKLIQVKKYKVKLINYRSL